jgi:soluble lytic murein transglycosylase-like protein
MKYKTTLFAAAVAFANPTAVFARRPEVKSFSAPAGEFKLIQPGFEGSPVVEADEAVSVGSAAKLALEFAALAPDQNPRATASIVQNLNIPAWMRASSRVLTPSLTLPPMTSLSLEHCGAVRYAPHPALNASQELRRQRYFQQMADAACGAGVPVELFDALIIQESRYNPLAVSIKGASGLTQLMPATARSLGVFDRWSVSQNLLGGARYLRKQLDTFGNWAHALGAYNAGPGNVTKYGGVPPFRETRGYVRTILSSIDSYQQSRGRTAYGGIWPRRRVTLASFSL